MRYRKYTVQNSIWGTPRDPQGICLYPILLSQPIGIRLCPNSWLDTRSSKVWEGCCTPARHQPLLCIQSLPGAQSWHSPEQLTSALLRLLPPTATLHPSGRPLDMEVSPSRSTFTLPTHSLELGHLFQVSPPRRNIICSLGTPLSPTTAISTTEVIWDQTKMNTTIQLITQSTTNQFLWRCKSTVTFVNTLPKDTKGIGGRDRPHLPFIPNCPLPAVSVLCWLLAWETHVFWAKEKSRKLGMVIKAQKCVPAAVIQRRADSQRGPQGKLGMGWWKRWCGAITWTQKYQPGRAWLFSTFWES